MKKYANPTFESLETVGAILAIYYGLLLWNWYQGHRAKILFAQAFKKLMEKNPSYWVKLKHQLIKEEMS